MMGKQVVLRPGARRPEVILAPVARAREGLVVLRTLATGIDGTDEDIVKNGKALPPKGEAYLVLGHEAVAVVERASGSLEEGDMVVPLVREGCGSCAPCGVGAVDFCPNDDYREHGIRELHGFMRERWTDRPGHLVPVPPGAEGVAVLAEPLSIAVKAFRQAERFQARLPGAGARPFRGRRCLVAGSGSLGTLSALLLSHEGARVWALDRSGGDAASSTFLRRLGVHHVDSREEDIEDVARDAGGFELILETTGAPKVTMGLHRALAGNGILALLGLYAGPRAPAADVAKAWSRMVMKNQIVFGSVNSARSDVEEALDLLGAAKEHAATLLTHAFRPDDAAQAFRARGDQILKKVIDWRATDRQTVAD